MPHLEEQFPPFNPLILQRPDALYPPRTEDREDDDGASPIGNRSEDEIPLPGTLANGIDRVTISANARVVNPIPPGEEVVPVPVELIPGESEVNPEVPELLDIESARRDIGDIDPADVEAPAGGNLQQFVDGVQNNRNSNEPAPRANRSPAEPVTPRATSTPFTSTAPVIRNADGGGGVEIPDRETVPLFTPANPVQRAGERQPAERTAADIEERITPATPPPGGPPLRGQAEPRNLVFEEIPPRQETQGLRGNTPVPRDAGRVNILEPSEVRPNPTGINIEETRNFGQGRTLSLNLATEGNDVTFIAVDTVEEALEEAGAILGPEVEVATQPFLEEQIFNPSSQLGFIPEPEPEEQSEAEPQRRLAIGGQAPIATPITPLEPDNEPEPELADAGDTEPAIPDLRELGNRIDPVIDPATGETEGAVVSTLTDNRQVFEDDQEEQALQPPAFRELDPDQPFIPDLDGETRRQPEDAIPAVAQAPVNAPAPPLDEGDPVAPPVPGNVEALNENPQALRRDNLGTDPALRSNRELRNFLQAFNDRIEPPEEVTEDEGAPVAEVQSNAPPPPRVFENLEAESAELLERVRARQAAEGVTRPEEERTAPPEPRTPETVLTERGQNIDRFI